MTQPATKISSAISSAKLRVAGIDLLRGLCIVAVVIHHINLRIVFRQSALGEWLGPAVNRVLFWNGYYGVRVFFVISGFLIAGWSLRRWGRLTDVSLKQFYRMRFARIVPCLAALLVLLSVLDRVGAPRFVVNPQHTSLGRALLAAASFHVNWLEARTGYLPAAWDVLWSLSVEEMFYVFFPLLCKWTRKQWLMILLLSAFVLIGPFARMLTTNELWTDYGYLSCMDGIALGCLAAMVAASAPLGRRTLTALQLCGGLFCLLITVFRGTAASIGFYKAGLDVTVLNLGTALLLIALQQRSERPKVPASNSLLSALLTHATAPLRWFGRNSYEVYLTHMLVVWPMVGWYHYYPNIHGAWLWFIAITVLAGVSGYLAARFYSEPLNLWLRTKARSVPKVAALGAMQE